MLDRRRISSLIKGSLRWRFGLQLRLALGFIAILALATGAVSIFTGYAAQREVDGIQAGQDRARAQRIHRELARYYDHHRSWDGVQEIVERASLLSGREILVVDQQKRVVAYSRGAVADRHPERPERRHREHFGRAGDDFALITSGPNIVGAVSVHGWRRDADGGILPATAAGAGADDAAAIPLGQPPDGEPPLTQFAEAVNNSLTLSGLAAGAVGVLLVLALSRRTLGSVGRLTAAARALGQGDLTQRVAVKGQDEIAELGHAFNAMADALEDAQRQRRSLVSDVAHELRTPLANIQGHIEAMQDGLLQPDAATLDTLHRQALYLSRLVSDLRLLAETESSDLQLIRQPESLPDIVARVAASFRPRAEAGGVTLIAETAPNTNDSADADADTGASADADTDASADADTDTDASAGAGASADADAGGKLPRLNIDRVRIEQVVGNLIDNAIRHTPPGGQVSVSVSRHPPPDRNDNGSSSGKAACDRNGAGDQRAAIRVAVSDTGAGIPPAALPYVFDRLYRVDPSRDRATGGAGLGLTIAKQLVEAHGGTIWAESAPGAGSRFGFDLPAP